MTELLKESLGIWKLPVLFSCSLFLQNAGFEIYTVLDFIQRMDASKSTLAVGLPFFIMPHVSWDLLVTVFPYAFLAAAVGLIESLMTLTLTDELTD